MMSQPLHTHIFLAEQIVILCCLSVCTLSLFKPFFWPIGLIGLLWCNIDVSFLLLFGLILTFKSPLKKEHKEALRRRSLLSLILLGIFIVSWHSQHSDNPWLSSLAFFLPFAYYIPTLRLSDQDSGGHAWTSSIIVFSLLQVLLGSENHLSLAIPLILLGMNAWYRELPLSLRLSLMFLTALLMIRLIMLEEVQWTILCGLILFASVIEKLSWGKHHCISTSAAWFTLILVCLALSFNASSIALPLHFISGYLLLMMASLEACRICMVPLRCREHVLSLSSRSMILLYTCALAFGHKPEVYHTSIMLFFILMSECAKLRKLKPLKLEEFPQNPCLQTSAQ